MKQNHTCTWNTQT